MKGGRLFFGALAGLLLLNILLVSLITPVDAAARRPSPPTVPAAPKSDPPKPPAPASDPPRKPEFEEPEGDMPLGCLRWEEVEELLFFDVGETDLVRLCLDLPVRP